MNIPDAHHLLPAFKLTYIPAAVPPIQPYYPLHILTGGGAVVLTVSPPAPSFSGKYRRKKVLTIIRISRKEKDYLAANGVCQGPGGDIHHTVARHRRTYYMTESENAENLLSQYRRSVTICSCQ